VQVVLFLKALMRVLSGRLKMLDQPPFHVCPYTIKQNTSSSLQTMINARYISAGEVGRFDF